MSPRTPVVGRLFGFRHVRVEGGGEETQVGTRHRSRLTYLCEHLGKVVVARACKPVKRRRKRNEMNTMRLSEFHSVEESVPYICMYEITVVYAYVEGDATERSLYRSPGQLWAQTAPDSSDWRHIGREQKYRQEEHVAPSFVTVELHPPFEKSRVRLLGPENQVGFFLLGDRKNNYIHT